MKAEFPLIPLSGDIFGLHPWGLEYDAGLASLEAIEDLVMRLVEYRRRFDTAYQLVAGDILNVAEDMYQAASQLAHRFGVNADTVHGWMNVARRTYHVRKRTRSRELTYSDYSLLAPLEIDDQLRWIGKRLQAGWTTRQFEAALLEAGLRGRQAAQTPGQERETVAEENGRLQQELTDVYLQVQHWREEARRLEAKLAKRRVCPKCGYES